MAQLNDIVRLLEDQRRDLLKQLDAVESAIAALGAADPAAPDTRSTPEAPDEETPGVSVRRVKAQRILTDSHKQSLSAAKRKTQGVRDAAKGIAREALGDAFVPAVGSPRAHQPPRLVRRPPKA